MKIKLINLQPNLRIMSNKLRTEKNCLNCGHFVAERFCSHCGQENIETKVTFKHQLSHVIGDITHFDSKFFRTVKFLFTKPGFLTLEYLKGKRISYVDPVRLFVFTSFLFFLMLGLLPHKTQKNETINFNFNLNTGETKKMYLSDTTTYLNALQIDSESMNIINKYKNVEDYTRTQAALPKNERDGFFTRKLIISTIDKRDLGKALGLKSVIESNKEAFLHKMHYGILILLPFFALLLKLLFRKSKLFYAEHLIFSFHLHTFILLLWILSLVIDSVFNISTLNYFLLGFLIYQIIALKKMFQNSITKTILKTILLFTSYVVFVGFFFAAVAAYTYLFN
jgi:hypothetical protein